MSASWSAVGGIDGEWLSARLREVASGDDTGFTVELLVELLAEVGLARMGSAAPAILVLMLSGSVVFVLDCTGNAGEC